MYGAVGTRVVLVASEPITRSSGDWVAVPRNTVLIVSHDKGGCLNVLSSPLGVADPVRHDVGSLVDAMCRVTFLQGASACLQQCTLPQGRREEVARCLEAATGAAEVASRPWSQQRPPRSESGESEVCRSSLCSTWSLPGLAQRGGNRHMHA